MKTVRKFPRIDGIYCNGMKGRSNTASYENAINRSSFIFN